MKKKVYNTSSIVGGLWLQDRLAQGNMDNIETQYTYSKIL